MPQALHSVPPGGPGACGEQAKPVRRAVFLEPRHSQTQASLTLEPEGLAPRVSQKAQAEEEGGEGGQQRPQRAVEAGGPGVAVRGPAGSLQLVQCDGLLLRCLRVVTCLGTDTGWPPAGVWPGEGLGAGGSSSPAPRPQRPSAGFQPGRP